MSSRRMPYQIQELRSKSDGQVEEATWWDIDTPEAIKSTQEARRHLKSIAVSGLAYRIVQVKDEITAKVETVQKVVLE